MKRKKLLIISHTEHYLDENQQIVGWGSTVAEINYLADFWEKVVHIGCFYNQSAPQSALPYSKKNICFVPIPPFGGKSIASKIRILMKIPQIIFTVIKNQKNVSEVQLRLPTSIGFFLLPLFSFFLPRKYTLWIKYAGNWNQLNPPLSYKIQRFWLKKNYAKCKVSINGFWPNQPKHCLSFENPCLTETEITNGIEICKTKDFAGNFTLIFIGRLDDAKGMTTILESLQQIDLAQIDKIHFIGDGEKRAHYEEKTFYLKDKVIFHGFLKTEQVHQLLAQSHFLLLPSKSEGFPKVVGEAACYGVIPIVSDVGSITHYINKSNAFVWQCKSQKPFAYVLNSALGSPVSVLEERSKNLLPVAKMFTFEQYKIKLEKYILTD